MSQPGKSPSPVNLDEHFLTTIYDNLLTHSRLRASRTWTLLREIAGPRGEVGRVEKRQYPTDPPELWYRVIYERVSNLDLRLVEAYFTDSVLPVHMAFRSIAGDETASNLSVSTLPCVSGHEDSYDCLRFQVKPPASLVSQREFVVGRRWRSPAITTEGTTVEEEEQQPEEGEEDVDEEETATTKKKRKKKKKMKEAFSGVEFSFDTSSELCPLAAGCVRGTKHQVLVVDELLLEEGEEEEEEEGSKTYRVAFMLHLSLGGWFPAFVVTKLLSQRLDKMLWELLEGCQKAKEKLATAEEEEEEGGD